jgi:IS30 family transposase
LSNDAEIVERLDRIANLMALSLVADLDMDDKRRTLAAVGYTANDIARLLHEKPDTIQKFLKREREAAQPKRRKAAVARGRGR